MHRSQLTESAANLVSVVIAAIVDDDALRGVTSAPGAVGQVAGRAATLLDRVLVSGADCFGPLDQPAVEQAIIAQVAIEGEAWRSAGAAALGAVRAIPASPLTFGVVRTVAADLRLVAAVSAANLSARPSVDVTVYWLELDAAPDRSDTYYGPYLGTLVFYTEQDAQAWRDYEQGRGGGVGGHCRAAEGPLRVASGPLPPWARYLVDGSDSTWPTILRDDALHAAALDEAEVLVYVGDPVGTADEPGGGDDRGVLHVGDDGELMCRSTNGTWPVPRGAIVAAAPAPVRRSRLFASAR